MAVHDLEACRRILARKVEAFVSKYKMKNPGQSPTKEAMRIETAKFRWSLALAAGSSVLVTLADPGETLTMMRRFYRPTLMEWEAAQQQA